MVAVTRHGHAALSLLRAAAAPPPIPVGVEVRLRAAWLRGACGHGTIGGGDMRARVLDAQAQLLDELIAETEAARAGLAMRGEP